MPGGLLTWSWARRLGVLGVWLLLVPLVAFTQVRRNDFYLTMDDGVSLDVALFEPTVSPPDSGFPAVVLVHGLGGSKEDMVDAARLLVLGGYVALSYSVRGQGHSGGVRTFSGEREREDLRAILDWLAARDNVNGRRIGILGGSQGGQHGWWAALYNLPVRAVAAAAGYVGNLTSNGCIETYVLGILLNTHVRYGPTWNKVYQWVLADAYDSLQVVLPQPDSLVERIRVPFFLSLAYKDRLFAVNEGLRQFDLLRCPKRLQLGTGYHGAPEAQPFTNTLVQLVMDWFQRWLRSDEGFDPHEDSVVVYHTDTDWMPHFSQSFPPRVAVPVTFYLRPDGKLGVEPPENEGAAVIGQKLLDPDFTPQTAVAEGFGAGTVDKFFQQVARFESEPFATDVTWVGAPRCTLQVHWSGEKMQLHVQFFDVDTEGNWHFLQRGNVAVRHARGVAPLAFDAQAYAHVFGAGHRLGVQLVPIDYVPDEGRCYVIPFFTSFADTVHLGGENPSRIVLPLINFAPAAVASAEPVLPNAFRVSPAWPNPFASQTTVRVHVRRPQTVTVRVLDVLGRTVRVCAGKWQTASEQHYTWDGRDAGGSPVPAGVYFIRVETPGFHSVQKICVLR